MTLEHDGFVFVPGAEMHAQLGEMPDWDAFAASWNDLELDPYMAGRYRRRRHAMFSATAHAITRKPHGPHYQSLDYNALYGGVDRWFEPIVADGPSLQRILAWCGETFGALSPTVDAWDIEAHQFRIEARAGEAGQPTPEGVHRDGVDWVLVLLVQRTNIASGTTTIHDGNKIVGSFTLAEPFDAALVDDNRMAHGVTPVEAIDPALRAYRDVLVVTFRRQLQRKPT